MCSFKNFYTTEQNKKCRIDLTIIIIIIMVVSFFLFLLHTRKLQLFGRPVLLEPKRGFPLGPELLAHHVDRGHFLGIVLDGRRLGAGPDHVGRDDAIGRRIAIIG